jgi:Secretion system C-terminal sorting domain
MKRMDGKGMKRVAFSVLIALVSLVSSESRGQSFTFVPDDTVLAASLGTEIIFNVTITNTSAQTLTLALVRTLNELPLGWESSMCLSVCYPPSADSIQTTPQYGSSPLNPGESREFSLHVYTATNNGTGSIQILARNTRDSLDQEIVMFHATSIPVGVKETPGIPTTFTLDQNYPNPFNPSTTIPFSIPSQSFVTLKVVDALGREIAVLESGELPPGSYSHQWSPAGTTSGVYFYRLQAGPYSETKKLVLLR